MSGAPWTSVLLVVSMITAVAEPRIGQSRGGTTPVAMTSLPVSLSVVATGATRDGRLVLLVLWRGAPRWYSSGNRRSAHGGGDQKGGINTTLQYGDVQVAVSFDPATNSAAINGKTMTVPAGTNVFLVDGVDTRSGGALTKALRIDDADVDLHPRLGFSGWTQVLRRSREVVAFLQCDRVPVDPRSVEPCQHLR